MRVEQVPESTDRKGSALYQLIDLGDDPTVLVGTQPSSEDEQPTLSVNWQLLEMGEWFYTPLHSE
jgi:hypothetical protein